jgi:ribosomal protein L29
MKQIRREVARVKTILGEQRRRDAAKSSGGAA